MDSLLPVFERAAVLVDQGRFVAAADLLVAAFRRHPLDGEVARELGLVLLAAGDAEQAIDFLERACHAAPEDAAAHAALDEARAEVSPRAA